MKRNKIITMVLATIVATSVLLPNERVFAETNNQIDNLNVETIVEETNNKENQDNYEVIVEETNNKENQDNYEVIDIQKVETTTSSSVVIEVPEEELQDNVVVRLNAIITGLNSDNNLNIGKIVSVKVTGYNSNNEKVILDENKLKYKWFSNGKVVGMKKELKITSNMNEEFITCEAEYPDEEKGGL